MVRCSRSNCCLSTMLIVMAVLISRYVSSLSLFSLFGCECVMSLWSPMVVKVNAKYLW